MLFKLRGGKRSRVQERKNLFSTLLDHLSEKGGFSAAAFDAGAFDASQSVTDDSTSAPDCSFKKLSSCRPRRDTPDDSTVRGLARAETQLLAETLSLGGQIILDGACLLLGFGPLLRELFQSFFQPVTDSLNGGGFFAPL
ncbi:MAG: hypothetical protein WBL39_06825 [Terrimicrobiaceae bacterium]